MGTVSKAKIIKSIIHELVGSFGQKLNPFLECGVETLTGPRGNSHIFIIGASHMSRMAVESISLGYPGFRAEKTKIEELGRSIEGKSLGETDTVSLDLLFNAAFMGSHADGLLAPAVMVAITPLGH
jgi:hypothetical protein